MVREEIEKLLSVVLFVINFQTSVYSFVKFILKKQNKYILDGVYAKLKKEFCSLLILLLSGAYVMRKWLKTPLHRYLEVSNPALYYSQALAGLRKLDLCQSSFQNNCSADQ